MGVCCGFVGTFSSMSCLYPCFVIFHFASGSRVKKWNFPELYTSAPETPLSSPSELPFAVHASPPKTNKQTDSTAFGMNEQSSRQPPSFQGSDTPQLPPVLVTSSSELSSRLQLWAKVILSVESPQQGAGRKRGLGASSSGFSATHIYTRHVRRQCFTLRTLAFDEMTLV